MMIRKMEQKDSEAFVEMSNEFYHSDAVLHSIPESFIRKTFDELMAGSPYIDGYIFECDGEEAGYSLLSITYSNEAGGLVVWVEEIYILPKFQGRGIGKEYMDFIEEAYKGKAARIRLEVEEANERAINIYKNKGYKQLDYVQMYKGK
ncbi:GNAT family N-acetyltransferase [Paenibacillus lutimineralis]|nr:N-acetyltransferase [Paenibacillus lutimineralis]